MSLVLYAAPFSSAIPSLHAIKELQIDCEIRMIDLSSGAQKQPDFLALNPNGKVPTLVVDGQPVFESLAILTYLGDRFGVERGLWPKMNDPKRLVALSWCAWAYVTFGAELVVMNRAGGAQTPADRHNPAQTAASREEVYRLLGMLEAHLARQPFMLGATFSLVDVTLASTLHYSSLFGVSFEKFAHIAKWLEGFRSRPHFADVWSAAPKTVLKG